MPVSRKSKKRISKKGLPPGAKVYTGLHSLHNTQLRLNSYNEDVLEIAELTFDDIQSFKKEGLTHWLDIIGVHDSDVIKTISEKFGIHILHQEDIMNVFQRPKAEEEREYWFMVLKMVQWDAEKNEPSEEQLSVFLANDTVLTFQEREGDIFDPIRERLKDAQSKARNRKADYLFYLLTDIIVDQYFEVVDKLGEKLESIEDSMMENNHESLLAEIQNNKKDLILLRKAIYPVREVLIKLMRNENNLMEEKNIRYLRDVYDHIIQILDTIDSYREINVSLKDIYLNLVSHELNKVMKLLTIISTVFIPLTFIVGVYGMNFDVMPELRMKYGYAIVWFIMLMIVVGLVIYFRKRKWL
jgi:magnesium transporter